MTRHPGDHGYTAYPGPAAVEARMRAVREAERPNWQAMTDALWKQAWGPPRPPGNGVLTAAFNAAAEHAALRQPGRTP